MKKILDRLSSQDIVRVLLIPQFDYFSLSVVFSQIAINMMNIVLIFLIFHLTNSNFSVSMLVLTLLVPQVVLSFVGGIVADIFNRRRVIYISNILRGLILLLLFFNPESSFLVYFVALSISIVTQFYIPAEASIVPSLVRKDALIAGNSVFGISMFGSILVGYILAGPVTQFLGRSHVFLLMTGFFMVAAFFSFLIPQDAAMAERRESEPVQSEISKTLRDEIHSLYLLLRYTKEAGSAFFLLAFSQTVIWVLATVVPGYAQHILDVPAESLSLLLFAPAALGMIISSVLIGSKFSKHGENKLMNVGIFLSSFALLIFPAISIIAKSRIAHSLNYFLPVILQINIVSLVSVIAFIAGFANALISVPSQTIIQKIVPESSRSKIFGLLFAVIGALTLIPIILVGSLADIFGVGSVLISMAVVILLIGILRVKWWRRRNGKV